MMPRFTMEMEKSVMEGSGGGGPPAVGCGRGDGCGRLGRRWGRRLRNGAAGNLRFVFGGSEFWTRGSERVSAVVRDKQTLVGDVECTRIEGEVKLLLEVATRDILDGIGTEVRRDVLPLPCRHVDFDHAAAASTRTVANAINDVRILGVGRVDANSDEGSGLQSSEVDLAPVATARDHDRACVLLRAHDPVGILAVGGDVVNLRDDLGIPKAPCAAVIEGHAGALV